MENRYLFRAKRIDNGEWVEGFYCKWLKGKRVVTYSEKETDCIITWMSNGGMSRYEVDPSTICQCTGMPDENKKLVFEHDIVWDSDARAFYEIIWNQEDMCWNVKDADGYKSNFEECYGSTIEVNGNSFDNPELLEV